MFAQLGLVVGAVGAATHGGTPDAILVTLTVVFETVVASALTALRVDRFAALLYLLHLGLEGQRVYLPCLVDDELPRRLELGRVEAVGAAAVRPAVPSLAKAQTVQS